MNKIIVSNSCVGHSLCLKLYELDVSMDIPPMSPLIASLFLDDFMYIKFLENYDYYMNVIPKCNENYKRLTTVGDQHTLMILDDVEIHWIHDKSCEAVIDKWERRKSNQPNKERISLWSTSEFMQIHSDEERKELINRFCNLPEYSILLTERKEEEIYEKNYAVIFVPEWENKQQNDRAAWGFLNWNDQILQVDILLNFLKDR